MALEEAPSDTRARRLERAAVRGLGGPVESIGLHLTDRYGVATTETETDSDLRAYRTLLPHRLAYEENSIDRDNGLTWAVARDVNANTLAYRPPQPSQRALWAVVALVGVIALVALAVALVKGAAVHGTCECVSPARERSDSPATKWEPAFSALHTNMTRLEDLLSSHAGGRVLRLLMTL